MTIDYFCLKTFQVNFLSINRESMSFCCLQTSIYKDITNRYSIIMSLK